MTITCKEAAHLVSEGLDKSLPPEEQLRFMRRLYADELDATPAQVARMCRKLVLKSLS